MFEKIDKEEDGEVYLREVVDYLDALDNNIEQSHKVNPIQNRHRHSLDGKIILTPTQQHQ